MGRLKMASLNARSKFTSVLVPLAFVATSWMPVALADDGCPTEKLKMTWDGTAWQCGGISDCRQRCDPPSKITALEQILKKEIKHHFRQKRLGEDSEFVHGSESTS